MTPENACSSTTTLHLLRDLQKFAQMDVISEASFEAYFMDSQAHVAAAVETGVAYWLSGMRAAHLWRQARSTTSSNARWCPSLHHASLLIVPGSSLVFCHSHGDCGNVARAKRMDVDRFTSKVPASARRPCTFHTYLLDGSQYLVQVALRHCP